MSQEVTYAIGDVHGEAERLEQLHKLIFERHRLLYEGKKLRIIHLGDYVDRGPDSAGVIELLMEFPADEHTRQIALAGNHEAMMLEALSDKASASYGHWLDNGGDKTLESYETKGHKDVPKAHLEWLSALPTVLIDAPEKRVFVHAGLSPNSFPQERKEVHLWTRSSDFFETAGWGGTALEGWTVVHGHTPTSDGYPDNESGYGCRINIDTGAVFGGRLTCAIFAPGEDVRFLYA
ncbi:MAG: metallophosphoesterase family protein [Pseudomonadota bacterium]